MTQPQAATPAPENPENPQNQAAERTVASALPASPKPRFLSRAREGGIIYPFIVLFIVLAIWKGSTFYGKTNMLELLDQQSATLIIAAAGTMVLIAAGSNAEAARLAGVRVQWIKLVTFAISGGAAGLAGIVVGGTSILGGAGAICRTVVGVLFIAVIGNGFTLLAWNPLYEQITPGRDPAPGGRRRRLVPPAHELKARLTRAPARTGEIFLTGNATVRSSGWI